jgi:hypothetical protein
MVFREKLKNLFQHIVMILCLSSFASCHHLIFILTNNSQIWCFFLPGEKIRLTQHCTPYNLPTINCSTKQKIQFHTYIFNSC